MPTGCGESQMTQSDGGLPANPTKVSLRIYNHFAEVRRPIRDPLCLSDTSAVGESTVTATFDRAEYECSISNVQLEGPKRHYYQIVKYMDCNLEGDTVYVRRSALRGDEGNDDKTKLSKAILVSGEDWLVRDDKNARYYYASRDAIEFERKPEQGVFVVRFNVGTQTDEINANSKDKKSDTPAASNQDEFILRYECNSISWHPKYLLSSRGESEDSNDDDLVCVAVIKNKSPRAYWVTSTELLAGQVEQASCFGSAPAYSPCSAFDSMNTNLVEPVSTFKDQQLSHLCLYELNNSFCLDAKSEAHIEFTRPTVQLTRFSEVNLVNPRSTLSQMMNSMISLKSDRFLPGGELCFRQDNRLVSKPYLSDLSANEVRELSLGCDSFSLVERKETLLKQLIKSSYSMVRLTISNNHDYRRRFRYREHLHNLRPTYRDLSHPDHMYRLDDGLEVDLTIGAKSVAEFHFKIQKNLI